MKHNFSKKFEEHVIKGWENKSDIGYKLDEFISQYVTDRTASVVEAGTGAGVLSFYLEESLKFENIKAFDILPYMIEKARIAAEQKKSNIRFYVEDASNLSCFEKDEFHYLLYLGQILSMVPKDDLNNALLEAYRICDPKGTFILSFMDWDSRWYNKLLSFNINFMRVLTGRKIQKYYLPELKFHNRINWKFYHKEQHPILWVRKKHMVEKLQKIGFKIEAIYKEAELTKNDKGLSLYFVCKKQKV
jgi:ubiquinone/menaquinone biosynthesis C-methylase UbiE